MRPRGEVRIALGSAAASLGPAGGTWRELAAAASVGFDVAAQTARNMARSGELRVIDVVRVPGVGRPMVRYAPAVPAGDEPGRAPGAELAALMRGWASFV